MCARMWPIASWIQWVHPGPPGISTIFHVHLLTYMHAIHVCVVTALSSSHTMSCANVAYDLHACPLHLTGILQPWVRACLVQAVGKAGRSLKINNIMLHCMHPCTMWTKAVNQAIDNLKPIATNTGSVHLVASVLYSCHSCVVGWCQAESQPGNLNYLRCRKY